MVTDKKVDDILRLREKGVIKVIIDPEHGISFLGERETIALELYETGKGDPKLIKRVEVGALDVLTQDAPDSIIFGYDASQLLYDFQLGQGRFRQQ